jgi:hypothetical protein
MVFPANFPSPSRGAAHGFLGAVRAADLSAVQRPEKEAFSLSKSREGY